MSQSLRKDAVNTMFTGKQENNMFCVKVRPHPELSEHWLLSQLKVQAVNGAKYLDNVNHMLAN